jgi:hypothetical protein
MQPVLSADQVEAFSRDGYLVMSGMLDDDLLDRLCHAGDEVVAARAQPTYFAFSVIEKGCIFDPPVSESNRDVFRKVALQSKLPQVAAELMQLDPETQNCRLLRYVVVEVLDALVELKTSEMLVAQVSSCVCRCCAFMQGRLLGQARARERRVRLARG